MNPDKVMKVIGKDLTLDEKRLTISDDCFIFIYLNLVECWNFDELNRYLSQLRCISTFRIGVVLQVN